MGGFHQQQEQDALQATSLSALKVFLSRYELRSKPGGRVSCGLQFSGLWPGQETLGNKPMCFLTNTGASMTL